MLGFQVEVSPKAQRPIPEGHIYRILLRIPISQLQVDAIELKEIAKAIAEDGTKIYFSLNGCNNQGCAS